MYVGGPEIDKLIIPPNYELKPFDLKLINTLTRNHPYQEILFLVYKYYCSYVDEFQGDILKEIDYFKLLDKYYRCGITFRRSNLYPDRFFGLGIPFCNKLYVYEDFKENPPFRYLIDNNYSLKVLAYNDVKSIKLDDVDKGEITLSEIEKWKRKVINKQIDRKTKLKLLDPNVYYSLITFIVFSNFEGRSHNKLDYDLSMDGNSVVDRDINKYKDNYISKKIYEDKIYNKIRGFLII